jgi:hypothetical protein
MYCAFPKAQGKQNWHSTQSSMLLSFSTDAYLRLEHKQPDVLLV